jgi:phospholipid/cholesterol/gamma-HCH transport system substrate-binding protein
MRLTSRPRNVIALALALITLASGCGLVGGGGGGSYKLIAYFPRAVSLYETSNVRVLGLPSGTVEKIEVIGDRVKVTMSMNKSAPVPQNVHAQIVPQSLIGERYIQLFPAWKEGLPQAESGHEIGKGDAMRTEIVIPVEPDEALAALNDFLKSLDPNGLGRLITNLSDDLQGNGAKLNRALDSISGLVATFADKDQQLVSIVDSFDRFTTTLRTRETQLGDIIRTFSTATQVLADERQNLQRLLASLASLSENALDLVVKHSDRLNTDIEILTRLAQSIDANLGAVGQLLDAGPMVASGIIGAYDPVTRSFNLRTQLGPVAADILNPILNQIGIQLPCIPIDTACTAALAGQSSSQAVPTKVNAATTPIDDLLGLVRAPTARPAAGPSTGARVADGAAAFASFLQDAAASLVGAS